MNVQITSRHFHASDSLKEAVTERTEELIKYYENITSAHIILDAEDELRKTAEIVLHAKGKEVAASAHSDKMGQAIDEAFEKAERQLKKVNEKIKEHKEKGLKDSM